jgi:hypothetical protein
MADMPAVLHCHYATDPAARPCCEVNAVLRRGDVALCASCDARRSSLGKGEPAAWLPAAPPADLLHWVATTQTRLRDAQAELAAAAHRARQHGHSWQAIGATLGITRQAAQQRSDPPEPGPPGGARSKKNSPACRTRGGARSQENSGANSG